MVGRWPAVRAVGGWAPSGGETNGEGAQHAGNRRASQARAEGTGFVSLDPRARLEAHEEAQINCKTEEAISFLCIFRMACELDQRCRLLSIP